MTTDRLQPLLEPRSVAVLGASQDPRKPGGVLIRNILSGGYTGPIYPVNPRGVEIAGLRTYRSVTDVGEPIDLAFVVVRREFVPDAIREAARAGVRAVVIVTAGFAEADSWGAEAQTEVAGVLREHGMVGIGPNTIGLVTMGGTLRGSFVHFPDWDDGPLGLIAQSGVFAGAVADDVMASEVQRIGIHASVGLGNRLDLDEATLMAALAARPNVGVIGLYLESFTDRASFLSTAAEVTTVKPVVLMKSARTAEGRRAARAHTGSGNTEDAEHGLDAQLARSGVIRAADDDEMMAILRAFAYTGVPAGSRVGIVTFSGAFGVASSDFLVEAGLELSQYGPRTLKTFQDLLPDWQRPRNPADLWPAVDLSPRAALVDSLDAALADDGVDQVLGILLAVANADFEDMRYALEEIRARHASKPLHLVIKGRLREEWTRRLEGLSIPTYTSVRMATRVMAAAAFHASKRP